LYNNYNEFRSIRFNRHSKTLLLCAVYIYSWSYGAAFDCVVYDVLLHKLQFTFSTIEPS